jgi:hypothetical protein
MQPHVNPVHRWLSNNRYQRSLTAALIATVALLLAAAPLLLLVALLETRWRRSKRRRRTRLVGLIALALLAKTVRWLWNELHGAPQRPWHPCAQCGRPIEAGRAWRSTRPGRSSTTSTPY